MSEQSRESSLIIDYLGLRKIIGCLGFCLPPVLMVGYMSSLGG